MSKEFNVLEVVTDSNEIAVEQTLTQLNELTLALVGGGNQVVIF